MAEGLDRLNVVVGNAGIVTYQFLMMEDNESTITVNVVSTFLPALLMLPKLRDTAIKFNVLPRLVIVASFVHFLTQLPARQFDNIFETLNKKQEANMSDRYNASQIMDILAVRELSGLMNGSVQRGRVILNCLNPGFCRTEIMREYNIF